MVHTGKPSGGCGVCRRRRIKCDEKRPECSYCIKTKQKCPGYINTFDLAWRDQTTVAQKNVERRQHARERARLQEDTQAMVTATAEGNFPMQICHEDPNIHSTTFFFSFYATPSNNDLERRAFFDYVVPLYFQSNENSTMRLSTLAVASIMFYAWMDRNADSPLARTYYLRAVSAMKEQLSHPDTCSDDEMLMSVLLLQMYENLVGALGKRASPHAHIDGALAIIKHRGLHKFRTPVSQGLLISVRSQAIGDALRSRRPVPLALISWDAHINAISLAPGDTLDTINARIANLAHMNSAADQLTEAHSILSAIEAWDAELPAEWRPVTVTGPECIAHSIPRYTEHALIYSAICAGIAWNKYRVAFIRVHLFLLSLSSRDEMSISKSKQMIQQAIDDICASVPYFLGDRVDPGPIADRGVRYPCEDGEELPGRHWRDGTAMGGYQLLAPLGTLMGMNLDMRPGQLGRITRVYNLG